MPEFQGYPKTPRLFRPILVTEKLDGTNAAIGITEDGEVYAQSRKRIITPEDDNFGFARWVHENADYLMGTLGAGLHYGEWWGSGIQRGYDLPKGEKQFSLFNVRRWASADLHLVPGLDVVPVLYEGDFSERAVNGAVDDLRRVGSFASPGFMRPEGVVVYHVAAGQAFKVLLENDDLPKSLVSE